MTPTYEQIKPYIEKGLISEQVHPEDADVRIFNYTQQCQFAQAWDDVTRQCRGLIMRVSTGEILARPFPKFFNYGEHVSKGWAIPTTTPEVYEKLDGSLGILYVLNGKEWIATRGSFTSDQAIWATKWWRETQPQGLADPTATDLFEIIYPANRIVVSYNYSGLVHLATIDIATGKARNVTWAGVPRAKKIPYTDMEALEKLEAPNQEGFVLYYPEENVRMKVKFAEYVRLHKLVTGLSELAIWEQLRDGKPLNGLIDRVPDEFYQWVATVSAQLQDQFAKIWNEANVSFNKAPAVSADITPAERRKEFALYAQKQKYPGILFAMYDNKPTAPLIWRMVRPHGARPFKVDIDQ